jgi:hypothetical protein
LKGYKYFCSTTDLEDDGIDLPDFDDRGCNTLTTIVVSEQDVMLNIKLLKIYLKAIFSIHLLTHERRDTGL